MHSFTDIAMFRQVIKDKGAHKDILECIERKQEYVYS